MAEDKTSSEIYGDPRTQLAAERTLLAWVRTGLALMGFGFVVARFGLFLRELATMHAPDGAAPVAHLPPPQFGLSLWTGVTLIVLGVAVNLLAAAQHWKTVQQLNRNEPIRFRPLSLGVALAVALGIVGFVIAAYLTVGLNPRA